VHVIDHRKTIIGGASVLLSLFIPRMPAASSID